MSYTRFSLARSLPTPLPQSPTPPFYSDDVRKPPSTPLPGILRPSQSRWRLKRLLLSALFILFPELVSVKGLCSTFVCVLCSWYSYKAGYLLGVHSSTPDVDSVFSESTATILHDIIGPRELRVYAQAVLIASACKIGFLIYCTLASLTSYSSDVIFSPKLPFTSGIVYGPNQAERKSDAASASSQVTPNNLAAANRAKCISQIKKLAVILCFALGFLRIHHARKSLIYHPVNSPALMLGNQSEMHHSQSSYPRPRFETPDFPTGQISNWATRHEQPVVPNVVHFVFGMDAIFGGKPFGFANYLSMYSAMVENKPRKVLFWYRYLPSTPDKLNWWYERILEDAKELGVIIELKQVRNIDEVHGRKLSNVAHKADVIRLEALLEHGGIYVDMDVYTIRSFAPLLHFETVLGLEGGTPELVQQGLCNAVIVAKPNAPFLRRWLKSYKSFTDNGNSWAAHSVQKPFQLALKNPEKVLVLDPYALFYPDWSDAGLYMAHSKAAESGGEGWDFEASQQFAYHAWSRLTNDRVLSKLDPEKVLKRDTSFNMLLRRWTSQKLLEDWRLAVRSGLVS